jgi:hypothetical protein
VAARSAATRLLVFQIRIPLGGMDVSFIVCCQVEVTATGRSLIQRSNAERGVPECDVETSIMRRPWINRAVEPCKKIYDVESVQLSMVLNPEACNQNGLS